MNDHDLSRLDRDFSSPPAEIIGTSFNGRNLDGRDFSGSAITNVRFRSASLREAVFTGAEVQADFTGADLQGARLDAYTLQGSRFDRANCRDCVFGDAELADVSLQATDLRGADLSSVVGLRRKEFEKAVTDATTVPPREFRDMGATLQSWERKARKGIYLHSVAESVYEEETGHPLPAGPV